MKTRFSFVALMSAITLMTANIAVANIGDSLDVNKDSLIDETDADIVILHLNTHGGASAVTVFPFDSEDLEDEAALLGSVEPILYNWVFYEFIYNLTPADLETLNYRVTWERKDVSGDGPVSPLDAIMIINWLNSH